MARDFCLHCGSPLAPMPSTGPDGLPELCVCAATPDMLAELERQEQTHLAKYARARPLAMTDLERRVLCDGRTVTVAELLTAGYVRNAIQGQPPRVAEREVVQLVYVKHLGSLLFTWPFCGAQAVLGGPHLPDRLRVPRPASGP